MNRSFIRGVLVGLLAPLAFLAALVLWVYRYTGMVPFPSRRSDEGEVAIRLMPPQAVPQQARAWREGLDPLISTICRIREEFHARIYRLSEPPESHSA